MDDARVRRCGLGRDRDGFAPERIDDHGRPVSAAGRGDLAVQGDDGVGAEPAGTREPFDVAAGGDDALRAAQLRGLERDEPRETACAEYEHAVARADTRPLDSAAAPSASSASGISRFAATVTRSASVPLRAVPSPSPKT